MHDLADSALMLALPKAFRAQRADAFARIAAELSRRLGVGATINDPAVFVGPTYNHHVSIPVESTGIQSAANAVDTTINQPGCVSVESTEIPTPFTLAPSEPGEGDIKAALIQRIHQMRAQGMTSAEIAAALNGEGVPTFSGRGSWQAGTVRNLPGWRG